MARPRVRRRDTCQYPGCTLFARFGSPFCHAHKDTEIPDDLAGDETMTYAQRLSLARREEHEARVAEFFQRIDQGDYSKLYTPTIAKLMESAAQEKGLDTELGALRYILAEVVNTVEDPTEKARTAATVARAIALVSRTARAAEGGLVEGLAELLHGVLGDLDREP